MNVLTKRSASPFDAGWNGAVCRSVTPFILQKVENSSDANCGPLSDTIVFGSPSIEKILAKACMVTADVVDDICETYGKPVAASTTISQ